MKKRYLSLKPLILWQEAEHPIDWVKRFQREALLDVEIGFGNGEFLCKLARSRPDRNIVGIEVSWGCVRRALRFINREELSNVKLLLVDTRVAFELLVGPKTIQRVYSLFPMPWPKERHVRHRVFSHSFLRLVNNRLAADGEVRIITDFDPYVEWIHEQVPGTGFSMERVSITPSFDTKYERKWCGEGQESFTDLRLIKQEHLDFFVNKEQPVKTYRAAAFDPSRFRPRQERGEVVVEFKDFLYDPEQKRAMARAVVVEDDLNQNIWLAIDWKESVWHIHVASGSNVVSTVGVQRALDLAYEAVIASMPEAAEKG
ncbi:MAG TPA: tRNA (guanosine(46)-N7)-methyltransferase TrmB [Thermodesulfobacteriota bacterium]|nr:tRNA (guanosine(46)-N7)-methyltransferase TrmB [Thermodesulfobacteriota bacterium]